MPFQPPQHLETREGTTDWHHRQEACRASEVLQVRLRAHRESRADPSGRKKHHPDQAVGPEVLGEVQEKAESEFTTFVVNALTKMTHAASPFHDVEVVGSNPALDVHKCTNLSRSKMWLWPTEVV